MKDHYTLARKSWLYFFFRLTKMHVLYSVVFPTTFRPVRSDQLFLLLLMFENRTQGLGGHEKRG